MEVLLIDDHPMLNAGIVSILEQTGIFKVCAQAQSLKEAIMFIEKSKTLPSLIILDMLLGDDNGLDFFPMLENYCYNKKSEGKPIKKPPVLVCSALGDPFKIQTALNSGAAGFLSKTGGKEELLKAIDTILGGKVYVSGEVNIKLKNSSSVYAKFSKREKDVIDLLKMNKSNKQIADTLHINIRTVENYISKIYFKTGYSSREEIQLL